MPRRPTPGQRARKPAQKRHGRSLWGKDTLSIERMSREGRGIAHRGGKIVFVRGALAGEQVLVQCTFVKKDYDDADMLSLADGTAPAAERIEPECPLTDSCGGCSLQHFSPAAQQQHKQAELLRVLRYIAPELEADAPITSEPRGFRHRLRLQVTRSAEQAYTLGLRRQGSNESVPLQHCMVSNSAINAALQFLGERLRSAPDLQGLREIEIDADSEDRLGLCFYFAAHPGEKVITALSEAVLQQPIAALRVRLNTQRKSAGSTVFDESEEEDGSQWQELYSQGELCLLLNRGNDSAMQNALALAYLPGDFTQTHWAVNAALVARAISWLKPAGDERALDLFAGIGNFSLPLALHTGHVHALESVDSMVARVASNARRNDIDNLSASKQNLLGSAVTLPRADIAIVDPPRAGAKQVCEALRRAGVKRLVYVSCHPATLARDAQILAESGFKLTRAAAVDMFPHTGHAEAIALFERK